MPLRTFQQGASEEVIQIAIRLSLLAALIVWCFIIIRPFIAIMAWGVVLAVAERLRHDGRLACPEQFLVAALEVMHEQRTHLVIHEVEQGKVAVRRCVDQRLR